MHVLIADDNHDMADSTSALLALAMQCETTTAYSGTEALQKALSNRPDALVLDLHMPGLDGVSVASAVRQHYADAPPYLIALTGRTEAVQDFPSVASHFDRVLAKPLDAEQLVASLTRIESGFAELDREIQPFDLAEVFTRAVQQLMPAITSRGLAFSFDCRGPGLVVEGDLIELQCGLHRMLRGLLDIMASGFVMFVAEARSHEDGRCSLTIEAAGSGALQDDAQIDAVLQRLHLTSNVSGQSGDRSGGHSGSDAGNDPSGPGQRRASGICPNTGAELKCSCDPLEGVLLQMCLQYPQAQEIEPESAVPALPADAAHAWLIDESPVFSDWGERRLQRMGWRVTRFRSCEGALAQAAGLASAGPGVAPQLLIVVESPATDAMSLRALQLQLPQETRLILAVMAGSSLLARPTAQHGFDVRAFPLSPFELVQLSLAIHPQAADGTGRSLAAPPGFADRPQVLVVDDNSINLMVGRGLVEALGCEVRTAHDGLDAIDQCRQMPPQLVLMDLNMPVLNGIAATLQLRELQRSGTVPPFAVVAATADDTREAYLACKAAGMDEVITKPLNLNLLRELLRRFTSVSQQPGAN